MSYSVFQRNLWPFLYLYIKLGAWYGTQHHKLDGLLFWDYIAVDFILRISNRGHGPEHTGFQLVKRERLKG